MMGRQSRQMAMIFVDIESLIPETHLLRKIERMVSFNFIYDLLVPYYPATGRPSVDPVSMFKMLLIGYLYGIESERQSGGWWRKFSSTSPTDGFADLNWMTPSQITPHSVRPEHENGSKAISFRKPSMK